MKDLDKPMTARTYMKAHLLMFLYSALVVFGIPAVLFVSAVVFLTVMELLK